MECVILMLRAVQNVFCQCLSLSLCERVHVHTLYRFFVKILMNCGRLNMKLTKVKWSVDVGCVEV